MPKPMTVAAQSSNAALVVGGGIAGIQAALDLADQGIKVYLVERTPSIGGRMAQLDKTFPTLDCSACILTPKMVDASRHENIELMTYCELKDVSGSAGNFTVKVLKKARYVDMILCNGCGICLQKCPAKVPSEFEMGLGKRRSIYVPFPQAVPLIPVIERETCIYFIRGKCKACEKHCPTGAIRFDDVDEIVELNVGAIILATGFELTPTEGIEKQYGYEAHKDVITSLELERLVSATGPTEGHLKRLSDGTKPENVAFIQCVGSRDQNGNYYCSRFCCMASIKEAILIKQHEPDTDVSIFYIDIRAFGKGFQEFYDRAKTEFGIKFIKGMVGKITENPDTKKLVLRYENMEAGGLFEEEFDMAVLALGAVPSSTKLPIDLKTEDDEFLAVENAETDPVSTSVDGIFACGLSEGPKDIPDSVVQAGAAAMRAALTLRGA